MVADKRISSLFHDSTVMVPETFFNSMRTFSPWVTLRKALLGQNGRRGDKYNSSDDRQN
jgi:hypothetical protein